LFGVDGVYDIGVGLFVAYAVLAVSFGFALDEFSIDNVLDPATPSAASPFALWNAFSADSVPAPKSPSTVPA